VQPTAARRSNRFSKMHGAPRALHVSINNTSTRTVRKWLRKKIQWPPNAQIWISWRCVWEATREAFLKPSSETQNSFYPRDFMRKRGLCCRRVSVCPSVCPSTTRRYCVWTAKPILKLFQPSGSPIILVFLSLASKSNSKENPVSGVGRKINGGGKKLWFSTEIAV